MPFLQWIADTFRGRSSIDVVTLPTWSGSNATLCVIAVASSGRTFSSSSSSTFAPSSSTAPASSSSSSSLVSAVAAACAGAKHTAILNVSAPVRARDAVPKDYGGHVVCCDLHDPRHDTTEVDISPSAESVLRAAALARSFTSGTAARKNQTTCVIVLLHRSQAAAATALLLASVPLAEEPRLLASSQTGVPRAEATPARSPTAKGSRPPNPPPAVARAWAVSERDATKAAAQAGGQADHRRVAQKRLTAARAHLPFTTGGNREQVVIRWLARLTPAAAALRAGLDSGLMDRAVCDVLENAGRTEPAQAQRQAQDWANLKLPAVPAARSADEEWIASQVEVKGLPTQRVLRLFVMVLENGAMRYTSLTTPGGVQTLQRDVREATIPIGRPLRGSLVLRLYNLPADAASGGQLLATASFSTSMAAPVGSRAAPDGTHAVVLDGQDMTLPPSHPPLPSDFYLVFKMQRAQPPSTSPASSPGPAVPARVVRVIPRIGETSTDEEDPTRSRSASLPVPQPAPSASLESASATGSASVHTSMSTSTTVSASVGGGEAAAAVFATPAENLDTSNDEAMARALQAMFNSEVNSDDSDRGAQAAIERDSAALAAAAETEAAALEADAALARQLQSEFEAEALMRRRGAPVAQTNGDSSDDDADGGEGQGPPGQGRSGEAWANPGSGPRRSNGGRGSDDPEASLAWIFAELQRQLAAQQQVSSMAVQRIMHALPSSAVLPGSTMLEESCQVCMGPYEEEEMVLTLPCFHRYHSACIEQWLRERPTCPMCLKNVLEHLDDDDN